MVKYNKKTMHEKIVAEDEHIILITGIVLWFIGCDGLIPCNIYKRPRRLMIYQYLFTAHMIDLHLVKLFFCMSYISICIKDP